jgi:Fe-S oxidoreductase
LLQGVQTMPSRPDYFNIPVWTIVVMYVFLGGAVLAMVAQLWMRVRAWSVGRPDPRFDRLPLRFLRLLKYGVAQVKIARQAYAGVMHLSIFWAMVVLFIGTVLATIHTDFIQILTGNVYLLYEVVLDGFSLVLTLGLGLAVYRRWRKRPPQLTQSTRFNGGLHLLFWIMFTGLVLEGLRLSIQQPSWAEWSPVGYLLSLGFRGTGLAESTLRSTHLSLWIVHFMMVGVFFVILPQDTLYLHLFASPLNAFFSDADRPKGALRPIENIEETEVLGIGALRDASWKTLLDADACTECGRCQAACPAFFAGQPLNPKRVILDIRDHLWEEGPGLLAGNGEPNLPLNGGRIKEETLWACTTCYACVYECPVLIEHVDAIVEMRRHLTLIEGKPYGTLQQALVQAERAGNPWGQSPTDRFAWSKRLPEGLRAPLMAERRMADILYWVGCAGSFDPKAQQTTLAMIKILSAAGVDFALLGNEEFCNCEWARRAGNEYLYQLVAEQNIETMQRYRFNRILTQCPHCFNTFKNEYPQFGGDFQVVHHSQFISELIGTGQLRLNRRLDGVLTFHDSCYLGRYNDIYDAPREALTQAGINIKEMPRSREKGYCCGGGGAHAWFELEETTEPASHRRRDAEFRQIQEVRLEEALDQNVDTVAAACPFCTLMLGSAAQSKGVTEEVAIRDIAEFVAECL